MGMFTEFIIDAKFKENTPNELIKCIEDMVNNIDNDLFNYERNPLSVNSGNGPFEKSFDNLHLKTHGEIKNYWNDIYRFVHFIKTIYPRRIS